MGKRPRLGLPRVLHFLCGEKVVGLEAWVSPPPKNFSFLFFTGIFFWPVKNKKVSWGQGAYVSE